jgi:hypothetical protein
VAGVPDPGDGSGTPVPAPGGDVPTGTGDGTTVPGTTDPTTTGTTQPGPTLHAAATGVPAPILATPSLLDSATAAIVATNDPIALAMLQNHTAAVPKPTLAPSLSAFPLAANLAGLPINSPIAKVQEPLLAAGDEAAQGGGFALAGLSSKALPGLLVVLATALVAAVGAANIRTWQERLARLHGDS